MNIYRGFVNRPKVGVILKTRKDRKPRDSSIELHNEADEYFFKKFGIKFRSQSIFCTGDIQSAKKYGKVAKIKPIGDSQICWSPKCFDLIEKEDFHWMTTEEFILENEYQIGNLDKAIESGNEIMIHCDRYEIIQHED